MKVYVIIESAAWDGEWVLGVYSTAEKAMEAAEKEANKRKRSVLEDIRVETHTLDELLNG